MIFNNRENKSVEGKQKVAALKKLKNAMVKAASSLNMNENASSISQISPEEMNKVIEDILQSYFDVENKFNYKTPDGKTVVRVDALIDYLKKIVEEDGMSFTNLCNIISNIFSYINTVGANPKFQSLWTTELTTASLKQSESNKSISFLTAWDKSTFLVL